MKIAITGHTKGIGKAISDIFDNTIGFSRSNGYDITIPDDRKSIVEQSIDCDVLINNAHAEFGQLYVLYDFWESWKDKEKIIINIGSRAADYVYHKDYPHYQYAVQKLALEAASKYMAHSGKLCKVTCIKPGYVDTNTVSGVHAPKIDPTEIASLVKSLLLNDALWIPTITIYPR